VANEGRRRARRAWAPRLEALEALRLLDAASAGLIAPLAPSGLLGGLPEADDLAPALLRDPGPGAALLEGPADASAWDAALGRSALDDWLSVVESESAVVAAPATEAEVAGGLRQVDRYLARAWARAGLAPQAHEDCTQAVHAAMLQQLGRAGFDGLMGEIGRKGITPVLSRDTELGPDFFRAVDMVKKRAQRVRSFQPLDEQAEPAALGTDGAGHDWRGALFEAIDRNLNEREATLIRATLEGFSPSEIAERWGLAPKTVSNEKTRALAKLREALVASLDD
jgi:hypothetical protein